MARLPKWLGIVLALAVVAILVAPALAAEAKGKIKSITADKKELVVTDKDGKDREFVMQEDAKISLGDKEVKLADLKEGDEVTLTYEKKDGKLMVSKILSERK